METFYAAAQPLMEPALSCLDAKPLKDHGDREQRLMHLILAFAHVAMAIEVQGKDEAAHSKLREHMRITRAPADFSQPAHADAGLRRRATAPASCTSHR
jgi:hypothetical protein